MSAVEPKATALKTSSSRTPNVDVTRVESGDEFTSAVAEAVRDTISNDVRVTDYSEVDVLVKTPDADGSNRTAYIKMDNSGTWSLNVGGVLRRLTRDAYVANVSTYGDDGVSLQISGGRR